jgi:hypothetical protein
MQECYKRDGHDTEGEGLKEGTRPQPMGTNRQKLPSLGARWFNAIGRKWNIKRERTYPKIHCSYLGENSELCEEWREPAVFASTILL